MIHIVDHYDFASKHIEHWRKLVPDYLKSNGYKVSVFNGASTSLGGVSVVGDIHYKASQFSKMYDGILRGNFSNGDIVIFANAWNINVLNFRLIAQYLGLDLKFIGVWMDGVFDPNSKLWYNMYGTDKKWIKLLEKSLYRSYNMNFFITPTQKNRFHMTHQLKTDKNSTMGGMLYDIMEIRNKYDCSTKEDIIFVPHSIVTDDQRDMISALRRYLTDFKFVCCYELKLTNEEYYHTMARSKCIFAVGAYETDPTYIYEGMEFGCIPVVPTRSVYVDVVPDRYHYDEKFSRPPFLNFIRGRDILHGRFKNVIENYESMVPTLKEDTQIMRNELVHPELLLKIINEI